MRGIAGVETLKTETERWIGGRERKDGGRQAVCWKLNFCPCSLSLFFLHRHAHIEPPLYNWIKLI